MTDRSGRLRTTLWVTLAIALYVWLAWSTSPRVGVTADEVVHLTGGYSYWTQNDYRLHPENGNLAQRLVALPLLALDLVFPSYDTPGWASSQANTFGAYFVHRLGNPVDLMLLSARAVIALVGAFTVWMIWRWARGLFGPRAGYMALGLAVFCPALLAHGALATSDMVLTAAVLAAVSAYWRLLHLATWPRLLLASLACGAAFLAKMSGVLIIPVLGALLLLRVWRRAPLACRLDRRLRLVRTRGGRLLAGSALTAAVAVGSLVVLWAGFGFRYQGANPALPAPTQGYYFSWGAMLGEEPLPLNDDERPLDALRNIRPPLTPGLTERLIAFSRDHRLLPEAYLWGFAQTRTFSKNRPAYLNGEYSDTGWPKFFPLAFLLKSTPASLLLFVGALIGWTLALRRAPAPGSDSRRRPWLYRAAPLLVFFGLYWVVAINLNLNIGHRHILPTYPAFYVLAASVVCFLPARPRGLLLLALPAAVLLHAGESFLARPHHLAYFSSAVGGEARGHHHLVDSSYDWGQGLPDLAVWLDRKARLGDATPVYLSYFGADHPQTRGLAVTRFGDEIYDWEERVFPATLGEGFYVIGATQLVRVYGPARGPWTERHEAIYQSLRARLSSRANYPASGAEAAILADARDLDTLQAARLFGYLRDRPPLQVIGGSLLLYRLTTAELAAALHGPAPR